MTVLILETMEQWKEAYTSLLEQNHALERDRSNLWGVNEELRNKILALEKGTLDLQAMHSGVDGWSEGSGIPQETL